MFEMPKLVDSAAWRRADVAAIAFLAPQGGPPGLGFVFRDGAAAVAIFDEWRRVLGPRDEGELLRVAIVEGERPGKPPGYVVTLQPDLEAIVKRAAASGGLSFDVTKVMDGWAKSMNTPPGGSPHLQGWKQRYAQAGEAALVPVVMKGNDFEPLYDRQLVKRRIVLRQAHEVTDPRDPDMFAMR